MKEPILKNYRQLLEDIQEAAISAKRKREDIELVVVTKGQSTENIFPLYEAGCRDFGESKLQEALPKMEALPKDIRWHLIGSLQRNKVRKALDLFTLIHSVDSFPLALKISECAKECQKKTSILLEVNISREASKHGFLEEELLSNFEKLLTLPFLEIKGLMAMGPLTSDEEKIANAFYRLKQLGGKLNLPILSMGMSQDYKLAIQNGATLLRIGSLIFKEAFLGR